MDSTHAAPTDEAEADDTSVANRSDSDSEDAFEEILAYIKIRKKNAIRRKKKRARDVRQLETAQLFSSTTKQPQSPEKENVGAARIEAPLSSQPVREAKGLVLSPSEPIAEEVRPTLLHPEGSATCVAPVLPHVYHQTWEEYQAAPSSYVMEVFMGEREESRRVPERIRLNSLLFVVEEELGYGPTLQRSCGLRREHQKAGQAVSDFIDSHIVPVSRHLRDRTALRVEFGDLWYLFQSGDEIVARPGSMNTMVLRVLRTYGGRQPAFSETYSRSTLSVTSQYTSRRIVNTIGSFFIDAFYLDFDGYQLTPVRQRFHIEPFDGERDIAGLRVVPVEYSTRHSRQDLVSRGQRFLKLAEAPGSHMACHRDDTSNEAVNDHVIIDMCEYLRLHKDQVPKFTPPEKMDIAQVNDYMKIESIVKEEAGRLATARKLTDRDYVLCYYRLYAYKLRSRTWCQVHIDTLKPAGQVRGNLGFDFLVLPPGHEEILRIQIEQHMYRRTIDEHGLGIELVQGKGQGLIILLHGAPGVGKTSTAESIAEWTHRPLYPITAGALGATAQEIESRLLHHLALADKWDCVVLLDEADLFLTKRTGEDFQRNSIIVLFLRTLEYYPGILILTTNRVGVLDEGFISRINISLFYPEFDENMTLQVWDTFIKRTQAILQWTDRDDLALNSEEIMNFARESFRGPNKRLRLWNGRQIRNAFQGAIALAENAAKKRDKELPMPGNFNDPRNPPKVTIGRKEFAAIATTIDDFDRYLNNTLGATFEQRAEHDQIRSSARRAQEDKENNPKSRTSLLDDSSDSSSCSDRRKRRGMRELMDKRTVVIRGDPGTEQEAASNSTGPAKGNPSRPNTSDRHSPDA